MPKTIRWATDDEASVKPELINAAERIVLSFNGIPVLSVSTSGLLERLPIGMVEAADLGIQINSDGRIKLGEVN